MREDNIYRLGRRFFKYRTLGMGAGSLMIFSFYFLYDALVIPRFPYLKGAPLTVLFLLVEMAFLYLLQWGAKRVAERTYYQVRADGLVFVNGRKQKIYLWKDFEQVEEERFDFTSVCPIQYRVKGEKLVLNQYLGDLWGLNHDILLHIEGRVTVDRELKEKVMGMDPRVSQICR